MMEALFVAALVYAVGAILAHVDADTRIHDLVRATPPPIKRT